MSKTTEKQRRRKRRREERRREAIAVAPKMPTYQQLRPRLDAHAQEQGQWAGLPMPVEERALVMAKSHPFYDRLHGFSLRRERKTEEPKDDRYEGVNSWYDYRNRRTVYLMRDREAGGRVVHGFDYNGAPGVKMTALLHMLGISMTQNVEAERAAVATLRTLIKPHMADAYEITGTFIETSPRSGICYMFRRLGTTLAFKPDGGIIAALCLHPIGYYDGTTMGAMVPTDDLIAHLVMMRTDEHFFWRKANHHHALHPGAQL